MDVYTFFLGSMEYNDIAEIINSQAKSFKFFLKSIVLDKETWNVLQEISKEEDVFIFSGIIRDFLSGEFDGVRDFDCVLKKKETAHRIAIVKYMRSSQSYRINSFGGMKIQRDRNLLIDVWYLEDTWGVKNKGIKPSPNALIETAFFNFSAIVYDFSAEKFIYSDHFCRFLKYKMMDVVYGENPNIPLCMVNIMRYWDLYRFSISLNLISWIKDHYNDRLNLEKVQRMHYGKVLYSEEKIKLFLKYLIRVNDAQDRLG